MSIELEEITPELSGDKKVRVHVLVYEKDWEWLGTIYGSAIKRGSIVRMLVRDFKKRIEGKAEQKL